MWLFIRPEYDTRKVLFVIRYVSEWHILSRHLIVMRHMCLILIAILDCRHVIIAITDLLLLMAGRG